MPRRLAIVLAAAVVGAVFASGLFLQGPVGGALLLLTDVALILLARVAWRTLPPGRRPVRIAVILAIAVIGAIKLVR